MFCITQLFFFFSQVRPSPDNLATGCLSEDVRNRNIRKVETNARIAFVVWIIEICANICIIIAWAVVYGKTTFATLTINMVWYYLILPHTFLMNTSHNKELIVDNGWKTTIRNALSLPMAFKLKNFTQNTKETQYFGDSKQEDPSKIFTISKSKICNQTRLEQPSSFMMGAHRATTSNGVTDSNTNKSQRPILVHDSSSDTTYSEIIRHNLGHRLYYGEQILDRMMNNIMLEESYLHFFQELLKFEETLKVEGSTSEVFHITELNDLPKVKFGKVKCHQMKQTTDSFVYENKKNIFLNGSNNASHEDAEFKTNFILPQSERIDLRRKILKDFHVFCTNEELYNDFLNNLINLEENFIE